MARGPVIRGACPAPGCTHTASLSPGARCPTHDRALVDAAVLGAHGDSMVPMPQ